MNNLSKENFINVMMALKGSVISLDALNKHAPRKKKYDHV